MKGVVRWTGEQNYEAEDEAGVVVPIYTEDSHSPMQMVLMAHGTCSMIDIIGGLKHHVENVRACWVELDAERAEESPRRFTAVTMRYVIEGDVPRKLVERIIEQSHAKYCSVGAMVVGAGATLDWELDLRA